MTNYTTDILKIKGDWKEVVDDCRATVSKLPTISVSPSKQFRRKILISEHSPIRDIRIKWQWKEMPHWITTHWVRHKWEKFVSTQREDRTGILRKDRSQVEPQSFIGEANTQSLIDTMRKRLCYMAAPETRLYAESLKEKVSEVDSEIGHVLVPNCIYRCGCPEFKTCGYYAKFLSWLEDKGINLSALTIQERYDLYNEYFYKEKR